MLGRERGHVRADLGAHPRRHALPSMTVAACGAEAIAGGAAVLDHAREVVLAHRFWIGAYSAMSLRSLPSDAKRTTTMPPGSTPTTTPVAEGRVHDVVAHPVLGARRRRTARCDHDIARGRHVLRRPRRAPMACSVPSRSVEVGRDLAQEAAGQPVVLRAEDRAPAREGQVEVAHGARDPDVAEAALLLERALVERARVREDALLAADDEDDRVLEALRVVQRHQGHEALVVAARVGVGDQRDLLQEEVERVVLGAAASNSRATSTSSSRFSMRPCASIVRSASSASR